MRFIVRLVATLLAAGCQSDPKGDAAPVPKRAGMDTPAPGGAIPHGGRAAALAQPLQAPLQVEEREGRRLVVAFGKRRPDSRQLADWDQLTVIGAFGSAQARLVETTQKCEEHCEEARADTCRWVGVYRLAADREGDAWAAFAGAPDVTVEKIAEAGGPAPARVWASGEFQEPVDWPGPEAPAYRWARQPDGSVHLETRIQGEVVPLEELSLSTCSVESVLGFERVRCGGVLLLYRQRRLILVNAHMESGNAADPLTILRFGDHRAYLVRIGLKWQSVTGLLVPKGEEWRLLLREPDYSVACPGA